LAVVSFAIAVEVFVNFERALGVSFGDAGGSFDTIESVDPIDSVEPIQPIDAVDSRDSRDSAQASEVEVARGAVIAPNDSLRRGGCWGERQTRDGEAGEGGGGEQESRSHANPQVSARSQGMGQSEAVNGSRMVGVKLERGWSVVGAWLERGWSVVGAWLERGWSVVGATNFSVSGITGEEVRSLLRAAQRARTPFGDL
jgi:hypothetical protein